MNGSLPPGLLPVGGVGGGVSKVTPNTVGVTDGLDDGLPPPAGHAGLLAVVVANPCELSSGIVSSVGTPGGLESDASASDGVAAIPALNTSTATARPLGRSECVRMAGFSTHGPGSNGR
ncbi:MAG TPA: hypothetical protein VGD55_03165 [Acidothermaceae bacterium]